MLIQLCTNIALNAVICMIWRIFYLIGSLSKPRRRRQRERHKTKGLMRKTIAVHTRYNFFRGGSRNFWKRGGV